MQEQDTKMRLKLYDSKGLLVSDRLIAQDLELNMGPKFKHEGPISLEVNLMDKDVANKVISYLNQLTGLLPIQTTKKVRISKGTIELEDKEPLEDLMKSALARCKFQEDLIKFLRDQGFRFIDTKVMTELVPDFKGKLEIKEKHEGYQFMIRLVKEAKDPRNDKYDYRLIFGIKVLGKRTEKVVAYLFGKFKTKSLIPWKKTSKVLFKKVDKIMVFPEHMDYEERKKWRVEHKRMENNPTIKPSKFYLKNARFVFINEIKGDEFYARMVAKYTDDNIGAAGNGTAGGPK